MPEAVREAVVRIHKDDEGFYWVVEMTEKATRARLYDLSVGQSRFSTPALAKMSADYIVDSRIRRGRSWASNTP